jgi:hypothetical protein
MWLRYEPLSACIDCTALTNEHGKETFDAVNIILADSTQLNLNYGDIMIPSYAISIFAKFS